MRLRTACAAAAALWIAAPASGSELAVYKGAGCEGRPRIAEFERFIGRPVDRVVDFLSRESWPKMVDSARWIAGCWAEHRQPMALSIPMLVDGGGTLKEGAAGAFDDHFRTIARTLVGTGHGDAILRLGWEFNGGWYPWAARKDPDAWIAYWRRIVDTMRSVDGARFRFDWNPTLGWQQVPADRVYPGDGYVDIIGLDVYNQTWNRRADTPERRWDDLLKQSYGLAWHAEFAKKHGKPMSFAEWGTGTRPDGHGGGDDPLFVQRMAEWIRRHPVLYHGYWDYPAPDFNARVSTGAFPAAGAELRRQFGAVR